MRSFMGFGKVFTCGKRSQQLTLTILVLFLTVSIVSAVPETNTSSTQLTLSLKTTNANGELLWNKTYGGTENDEGYCVVQTSDGGYIITGKIVEDLWLIKTDKDGNQVWNQTYAGSEDDLGRCVEQTDDGGYIIVGSTESFGVVGTDVWLIKTNSTGGHEWNQTYGGTFNDEGYSVTETSDGGYIISGYYATSGLEGYVWLIKTDANGDHQWNETYLGGPQVSSVGYCVVETSDGGYIIVGYTQPVDDSIPPDVLLIKTDSTGGLEWSQTYGGTGWDEGFSVLQSSDEGYIIAGYTQPYGTGNSRDVWLIKTNENGDHLWNQTYGGTLNDEGKSVVQTTDGGYIITGTKEIIPTASTMSIRISEFKTDVFLIKTDENGNHQWNQTYGEISDHDEGWCVVQTSDGNYIIVGYTESYGAGGQDVWLLKVASGFPVIDHPADITYEEGSSGHNITWQALDAEPSSYTITNNEILLESGPWAGGNITINVDGLSIGVYLYTCTVNDTVGQYSSDTVMVTVTEPEEDGGFPWAGFALALAVVGLAAVIIYQTQYAKKT